MHPCFAKERARHKKKRLVQSPNSYFMDVKCVGKGCCRHLFFLSPLMLSRIVCLIEFFLNDPPGCYKITTIFSHAQTVVPCTGCSLILCQPRGGKCRLTEGETESHSWKLKGEVLTLFSCGLAHWNEWYIWIIFLRVRLQKKVLLSRHVSKSERQHSCSRIWASHSMILKCGISYQD